MFAGNVTAMSAGTWHSMVLKNNGDVWVTGLNDHGQLGIHPLAGNYHKIRFVFVIGTWDITLGNTVLGVRDALGFGLGFGLG